MSQDARTLTSSEDFNIPQDFAPRKNQTVQTSDGEIWIISSVANHKVHPHFILELRRGGKFQPKEVPDWILS